MRGWDGSFGVLDDGDNETSFGMKLSFCYIITIIIITTTITII